MLERLSRDNDFVNYLKEEEAKEATNLIELMDPVKIHRAQGRATFVRGLLTDMNRAIANRK